MTDDRDELVAIAGEAYVYCYPLVTMELTRLQATNVEPGTKPGTAPMNQLAHIRSFPSANFRLVVRPNFDTLYSAAFLDLRREPVIVSAPAMGDRYYMLPLLDMWTDVFAAPGTRTTGQDAGAWAVVPSGWSGTLPKGVARIDAPTVYVWLIGRTQTNGPADYDAVHAVQDGFGLHLLSEWGKTPADRLPDLDPGVDMTTPPLDQVNALSGPEFFTTAADLLRLHRPHLSDWSQVARLGKVGLVPGEPFDPAGLDDGVRAAVELAPRTGQALIQAAFGSMGAAVNGWRMLTRSIGVYGNAYAVRAAVAMGGLGANPPEDAVYPLLAADDHGDPPDGAQRYRLHFDADQLPPARAFWSVTVYDEHGFQAANPIDRFALGDRDPLVYGADGSLDLYLQHDHPGPEHEANWLPTPTGPLGVTMRLYLPDPEVLAGRWAPPPLQRS